MILGGPEGVYIVRLGGADQRPSDRIGGGGGVGDVGKVGVAGQRLGQCKDDGRGAIWVFDKGSGRGRDRALRGGKTLVQCLGDDDVHQRAVPVILKGGGDGDGHAWLVGGDGIAAHDVVVLLAEVAVDTGPLSHRPQERVEHLGVVVNVVGGVAVKEHHPPVASRGDADGDRAGLGCVGKGGDDAQLAGGCDERLVEDVGLVGQPGKGQRVVG